MTALPVTVLDAMPTTVPLQTEVVGQTEGAKEVEIRPRVGGILLKKLFNEGEPIKAGQAMFLIDSEPFKLAVAQSRAQLAQQKVRVEQTQREEIRLKELLETHAVSQREYDNTASDLALARASQMQAQAQLGEAKLNLSYTTVTAPYDGIAGRFLYSEGALVSANTSLLAKVSQISPIWVRFSLSESELTGLGGKLNAEQVQDIRLHFSDGSIYPESGKLSYVASVINPNLGTQELRAEFANENKTLLPGQFVRVSITTGKKQGVFLLPPTAVLTGEQGKFVYVVEKNALGKYTAGVRPITEAGWYQQQWVVLSGLKKGDGVLIDNLIKLRPGAEINPHSPEPSQANPNTQTNATQPTKPATAGSATQPNDMSISKKLKKQV